MGILSLVFGVSVEGRAGGSARRGCQEGPGPANRTPELLAEPLGMRDVRQGARGEAKSASE